MTQNVNDLNDINSEVKDMNMKSNPEISYVKKAYYYCDSHGHFGCVADPNPKIPEGWRNRRI